MAACTVMGITISALQLVLEATMRTLRTMGASVSFMNVCSITPVALAALTTSSAEPSSHTKR